MSEISSRIPKIFKMLGRNAKVLLATEPFWSLPMSWVFFYRFVFLREAVGLSEVEIGFLSSSYTVFSIILPLAGGYLADRFGRKRVFMLFDSLGWLSSLAIWIVTQNIWYALGAAVMEAVATVIYPVWECLLVEDTDPEYRASIYGSISATYSVGALCTPLAGYIIGLYGIDLGARTLFALAFLSMVPMFIIRQRYLRETELGYQIIKEKRFAGLKGYSASFSVIRRNRILVVLLFVFIMGSFYYAVNSYLPLYLIDSGGLGLREDVASLVPAASSTSALIIALLVVPKLKSRDGYVKALASGIGLGCISILILVSSPKGYLPSALASGVLLGFYSSTAFSVSRTFLTNEIEAIDSSARAKILSINITLSSLLNLPSPPLAGYLFSLEPKLPFIALSIVLVISVATLLLATRKSHGGA